MLDSVLVLALAAAGGSLAATSPLVTGVTGLAVFALLWRRARRVVLGAAIVVLALSALRARLALADFERDHAALRQLLAGPRRCAMSLRVVESPTLRGDRTRIVGDVSSGDCEGRALPPRTRVAIYGGSPGLRRGDELEAIADLAPVRLFRNLGAPDPTPRAAARGVLLSGGAHAVELTGRKVTVSGWVDAARAHARRRILNTFTPQAQGLARALVLGENDLDDEEAAAFQKSGLSHLLAVSGTHLVFAVVSLVLALRWLLVRIPRLAAQRDVGRITAGAGMVLALAYADFAGGSGSAWRAAWMLSAAYAARVLGRGPATLRAVAWSIVVGLCVDPLAAYDLSFMLSLAATTGLLVLSSRAGGWLARVPSRALKWLLTAVAATLASMIPCAPLLALMSAELTLAGIAANVIAAPFGELVSLPLCLVHPLIGVVPSLERGVALTASGALVVVSKVARWSAAATWAAVPVPLPLPFQLGLCVVVFTLWLLRARRWQLGVALALLLASEGVARRAGVPKELRVTALDVGQGDATLLDLPGGELWLVDGGGFMGTTVDPGKSVILPQLRARRRTHLDVVVLSHPHPDHFGGLRSVLEVVSVGELWDTGQGRNEGAGPVYAELLKLARARGIRVREARELCGRHERSGAAVTVLGPCPTFTPGRHANDNSVVLHVAFGRRAALLPGDAEAEQERELLRAESELRADFLKVGHHGSRTSSSAAFLEAVRPSVGSISCGVRNRFGHPHWEAMRALSAHGVAVLRTDDLGSVVWSSDGEQVGIAAYLLRRGWLPIDGARLPP
ncbi:MAG: DNA internalization-related competence protein ComEC/Rec2 [Polyangiaceae bacterium]